MKDIQTEADIEHLVDSFYAKVLVDPVIGYIFTEVVQISIEKHMPIMYSFWNSVLLGKTNYKGNPMIKHIELHRKNPLLKNHFDTWLALWHATVRAHFQGPNADMAIGRANSIAGLMQHKIGIT
jgi:hemoglobin